MYVDIGTGTAVANSLWPLVVAFFSTVSAFLVKHFWSRIKGFFSIPKY